MKFWMVPIVSQVVTTQFCYLLSLIIMWKVVSQPLSSCACLLIYLEVVNGLVYQLSIPNIEKCFPKAIQEMAISIMDVGLRKTLKPK